MEWIWFGVVVALILIEISTLNLITIWYVISGIIALIFSLFINNYSIQFIIFVVIGTILLITCRDWLVKFIENKSKRFIGKYAIVTKEIKKNQIGEVKIGNKFISRRYIAVSNKKIKVNSKVKIIDINNNRVKVTIGK